MHIERTQKSCRKVVAKIFLFKPPPLLIIFSPEACHENMAMIILRCTHNTMEDKAYRCFTRSSQTMFTDKRFDAFDKHTPKLSNMQLLCIYETTLQLENTQTTTGFKFRKHCHLICCRCTSCQSALRKIL